jgi:hypothetical protein
MLDWAGGGRSEQNAEEDTRISERGNNRTKPIHDDLEQKGVPFTQ